MTFAFQPIQNVGDGDGSAKLIQWTDGRAGDQGASVELPEWADICMQATGTIGTSTLTLEGSNDGNSWSTLNNAQGTPISSTSLPILKQVVERPRFIRPALSAGTASGVTVSLMMRRANPMRT